MNCYKSSVAILNSRIIISTLIVISRLYIAIFQNILHFIVRKREIQFPKNFGGLDADNNKEYHDFHGNILKKIDEKRHKTGNRESRQKLVNFRKIPGFSRRVSKFEISMEDIITTVCTVPVLTII